MKHRTLGLALVALASVAALAGCGSAAQHKTASNTDTPLRVWDPYLAPSQSVSSWKKSPFHSGINKASGIEVKWEFPSQGTDASQAYNLMMASKNRPDIIDWTLVGNAEQYIKDGTIWDLTKILPKKAPHYWAYLQKHPEYQKELKTDSGKMYGFGFFRETEEQSVFMGPMIRKDWLDALGLPIPKDINDWETTIKAFNQKYGAKYAWYNDVMTPGLSGAFGSHATNELFFYRDPATNKVQLTQAQPEWKAYMTWLNKMYKAKLIDPDIATMTEDNLKTKILNNKVGITFGYTSRVVMYNQEAKAKGSKANWVPIPYPNQANGKPSAAIQWDGRVNETVFAVSKTTTGKRLDKALKWLDWAFTKKGSDYWNMGQKGVSYTVKDGKQVFTDKVLKNKLGTQEGLILYTGNYGNGLGVQSAAASNYDPQLAEARKQWFNDNKTATESTPSTNITMTTEESKQATPIINTLGSYVGENMNKFITGQRPISEFDKFVQEMNDQGLKTLTKIKQAAFDRYLKR